VRLEYKYLVSDELMPGLRALILPFVEVDRYAAGTRGEYTVRSIYFDTPRLDFYHDKVDGLEVRKKLRIRGYNEYGRDDTVFLEIKRKHGAIVTKHRAPVPYSHVCDLLLSGAVEQYALASEEFPDTIESAGRFLFHLYSMPLLPTVLIIYEREAYHSKINNDLRITFDKNLRSSLFPSLDGLFLESQIAHAMAGYFTLEIKTCGGIPAWLRAAIGKFNLRPMAISKYVICLDRHGLPQRVSEHTMLALSHGLPGGAMRVGGTLWLPGQATHPIFQPAVPGWGTLAGAEETIRLPSPGTTGIARAGEG